MKNNIKPMHFNNIVVLLLMTNNPPVVSKINKIMLIRGPCIRFPIAADSVSFSRRIVYFLKPGE
jgi:hypothetical protein